MYWNEGLLSVHLHTETHEQYVLGQRLVPCLPLSKGGSTWDTLRPDIRLFAQCAATSTLAPLTLIAFDYHMECQRTMAAKTKSSWE